WDQGDFPFLFVQLANYETLQIELLEDDWAELREAQLMTLALPNTGMAVAIDIGDAEDIHPRNKQDVGQRLSLNAMNIVYGKSIVHSGPIYESMEIEENKIRLSFKHIGSGLVSKSGGKLTGFSIAGDNQKFHWANAVIEGETITVFSDKVQNPISVRYAWATNPIFNLYNKEGLPASPFRTDSWKGITE
ncbi:MAG: sialate O-acetylesterase, partial [Candidatus Marinimicrobia bacterium]|nr:sialate O-acetylesterase [Candidatus Neomarinimicrobiota bacterium]